MNWRLKKKIRRVNETKTWFFGKINKIEKLLAQLNKNKRGRRPN
jgi:hypothetical protein